MSKKISGSPFLEMIANPEKLVPPPEIIIVPKPTKKEKSKKKPKSTTTTLFSKRASRVSQFEIPLEVPPPPEVENDENEKREILFKFDMIKRKNPNYDIPDYSIRSELNLMKTSYDLFVRRLTVDNTVDTYKQYLTFAFLIIELVGSKMTKLNFKGLTAHHHAQMNTYDKLLIELGEKMDPDGKSKLPVEIRLGLLVAMNSLIFVGTQGVFPPDVATKLLSSLSNHGGVKKMRRPDDPGV